MKLRGIIIFWLVASVAAPIFAVESKFKIERLEEVYPRLSQKIEAEKKLSSFHSSQLAPTRDKAVLLFRDKIEFLSMNGRVLLTYQLADYGLYQP